MAKTVVFPAQTLEGFAFNNTFGAYVTEVSPAPFSISPGADYKVVWDGEVYTVTGQDASAIMEGVVVLGNAAEFGLQGNNEPFAIGAFSDAVLFMSNNTDSSHSVEVYQGEDASMLLKDRSGNDISYPGAKLLRVPMSDGTTKDFVSGTLVEKTVTPDFSAGSMEIVPAEESFFAKVTVQRPETLIPDNIVSGINVAGVVGSFKGSAEEGVQEKDVNFFDYDGTLLYSYNVAEAAVLSVLPPLPSHDGLVCQGWNYTLEEIKERNSMLDIGAVYITDDGKTRIYIKIPTPMNCYLFCSGDGVSISATIDWGDGTAVTHTYASGNYTQAPNKSYEAAGEYCITISCSKKFFLGKNGTIFNTGSNSMTNANIVRVHLGNNADLSKYSLQNAYALEAISIPEGNTALNVEAFNNNNTLRFLSVPRSVTGFVSTSTYNINSMPAGGLTRISLPNSLAGTLGFTAAYMLKRIILPPGITGIGSLQDLYSLKSIAIPSGVTTLNQYALYRCYELESIALPEGVTTIGQYFASMCPKLRSVILPSTLASIGTNCFKDSCSIKIYVPDSMVSTFKSMTNLTAYADAVFPISEMKSE